MILYEKKRPLKLFFRIRCVHSVRLLSERCPNFVQDLSEGRRDNDNDSNNI